MTHINVGYSVRKLTTKHLIAEHREIKRVPNMIKNGRAKIIDIPLQFSLGKGHVKFFYDKLGYLLKRYKELYAECKRRGFKVQDYSSAWDGIPERLMGDYKPTKDAKVAIEERIAEKLYGKNIFISQ